MANDKSQMGNPLRGVFHCFNGSRETAEQILKLGFYLGVGGVLTFKNCKLAEVLSNLQMTTALPIDRNSQAQILNRLLLETDAPYMAPVPYRGERNESRFMIHVAERLADVFEVSLDTIMERTNANAKALFKLK